jgi:DNA-binding Lrp family transcriptional regulator
MDSTDQEILDILKQDGRASYTDVADKVGVSEGTVRNRVETMVEENIIENFTVETSNHGISAVVLVKLSMDVEPEEAIQKFPDNMTVYEVTGEHDLILIVDRESTEALNDNLDNLRKVKGVKQTVTKSVLKKRRI